MLVSCFFLISNQSVTAAELGLVLDKSLSIDKTHDTQALATAQNLLNQGDAQGWLMRLLEPLENSMAGDESYALFVRLCCN